MEAKTKAAIALVARNIFLWPFIAIAGLSLLPIVLMLAFLVVGFYAALFVLYFLWDKDKALVWWKARRDIIIRWSDNPKGLF